MYWLLVENVQASHIPSRFASPHMCADPAGGWRKPRPDRCADLQARFFLNQVRLMDRPGAPSITWVHLEIPRCTWHLGVSTPPPPHAHLFDCVRSQGALVERLHIIHWRLVEKGWHWHWNDWLLVLGQALGTGARWRAVFGWFVVCGFVVLCVVWFVDVDADERPTAGWVAATAGTGGLLPTSKAEEGAPWRLACCTCTLAAAARTEAGPTS
jgi:hypothetical protein